MAADAARSVSQAERFLQLLEKLTVGADLQRIGLGLMVALQEIDFNRHQQISLFKQIYRLRSNLPVAQGCLNLLQTKWFIAIKALEKTYEEKEAQNHNSLLQQQQSFMGKVAELLTSTNVLHGETYLAETELFVALLDHHFVTSRKDTDGRQRRQVYEDVYAHAVNLLSTSASTDAALSALGNHFKQILRTYAALNPSEDQKIYFDTILSEVTSSDGQNLDAAAVKAAMAKLNALSWRGILPYYADNADCALLRFDKRMLALAPKHQEAAQPDAAYEALAHCLKTKFSEHLIYDDAFAARETSTQQLQQDQATRTKAFANALQWLASQTLHPEQLNSVVHLESQLQALCNDPEAPVPQLPTVHNQNFLGHDDGHLPKTEAFDSWLAHTLHRKESLTLASWETEIIPACAAYIARCKTNVASTVLEQDLLPSAVDETHLAAIHALLAELHDQGSLSQALHNQIASLRKDIATLQDGLIEREILMATKRERSVQDVLSRAQTHDPRSEIALKKALQAAAAYWGDTLFTDVATSIAKILDKKSITLSADALTQLWLALPDSFDLIGVEYTLNATLPENWATALRAAQCLAAMQQALAMDPDVTSDISSPAPSNETPDAYCERLVASHSATYLQCMQWWETQVKQLRQTPHLTPEQRAYLLGLLARKLTHFGATETLFPRAAFEVFVNEMNESEVMALLGCELNKPTSLIITGLQDPSFELNKYVLGQTWIIAHLGAGLKGLLSAEQHRLVALLSDLVSTGRKALMQNIVEALAAGGTLTADTVDAVGCFVDHSFELDTAALAILAGRAKNPGWLSDLSTHTTTQRSRLRTVADLTALMAAESAGINRSIAQWLDAKDEPSKLQKALAAVQEALQRPTANNEKPIAHWSREDITDWAMHRTTQGDNWHFSNRGQQLWQNPQCMHIAMAVVYRAIELAYGFSPRDTQLATLYLIVRDSASSQSPGKLAQVATGEGKSVITAGIAILKALGGHSVDVITTSKVLAVRDAAKNAPLYTMFGLQVANNCDEACEHGERDRSAEQIRQERYFANGRPVEIVYGEAGAFERDQLLTEFYPHEPEKQIMHLHRQDKARRCALVDEVDGLLLDNASMVLYLSHEIESLRQLEQLFVQIWELTNSLDLPHNSAGDDNTVAALSHTLRQKIETGDIKLPGYDAPNAPYVAIQHLVERRLKDWIKSALYARTLRLNHEYIVVAGKKPAIVVMDKGTGVEQASVKWSHGLHQFIQLKHGLEVSPESLKAVFLSNLFFFKQYKNQLFGLTGTLGSEIEQTCLSTLFGVEFFKIPRAYGEKYVQKSAIVKGDVTAWSDAIADEITMQHRNNRATLVVCDTIDDVFYFKNLLKDRFTELHTYTSSNQQLAFLDATQPRALQPGDLIIATNLAGRGTDLKTSKELEKAGGLHVILSYLPSNVRIQEQAFGRTARSGNKGTGQFILCDPSRRPIHELCRLRDLAEKQRLEKVLQRDVRRIEFEHDLLMGFSHHGEKIGGFALLLKDVSAQIYASGQPPYYATAQIDSLKNRWASWLDDVGAKLDLVHIIGRDAVVAAYQAFELGVAKDLKKPWEGLIVEPAEWIKLGAAYRRDKRWREAERCYACAARDPAYAVARYYKAACRLMHTPTRESGAKKNFRVDAKAAAKAVEQKLQIFQNSAQIVSRLATQSRLRGDQGFGDLYQARVNEKLQIWQIFLSAIEDTLGEEISPQILKKSAFITSDADAKKVIEELVKSNLSKPMRVSNKFSLAGGSFKQQDLQLPGLQRYAPVASKLAEVLRPKQAITQEALIQAMQGLMTLEQARTVLKDKATLTPQLRLGPIPDFWVGWDEKNYASQTRSALCERYTKACQATKADKTLEVFKQSFLKPIGEADGLAKDECIAFFELLQTHHIVTEDHQLHFEKSVVDASRVYADDKSAYDAVTKAFKDLDTSLVTALAKALIEQHRLEASSSNETPVTLSTTQYRLKNEVYLSDLPLFASTQMAAKILWGTLTLKGAIKPPKLKLPDDGDIKVHADNIKAVLRKNCALDQEHIDEAVDSVYAILESTIGMMRSLNDAQITVKFVEIARAYFLDHAQAVPPALREFVEAGLDVVVSLIEKKDPPTWYEVTTLIMIGMTQIIAGVLIKEFVPVAGELLGNFLINTGLDDIIFGVSSAIHGEFSWDLYWTAKQSSMLNAAKNAAIVSAASFTSTTVQQGIGEAWRHQQLSHVDKLHTMARVSGSASYNIASHVAKEVSRAMVSSGISQIASRGIESVQGAIANIYASDLERSVQKAVRKRWPAVVEQAQALYEKLQGDASVAGILDDCIQQVLRQASQGQVFTSIVRTSKPAVSIAASGVAGGGWSKLLEAGGDLAHLGVSVARMATLVETEVSTLARKLREAKERKIASDVDSQAPHQQAFQTLLNTKEDAFTKGLVAILNNLLSASVYCPLISYSTQFATDKVVAALLPQSEVENWAASSKHLSKALEQEAHADTAYFDDVLRDFRGADAQIHMETLHPEERAELRQQMVEGTGKTLGQLQVDYEGCQLNVYYDGEHRLYVQRPAHAEYSQGIRQGKPAGDPELIAQAQLQKRPIILTNRHTGAIKTYHEDGRIDQTTPANAIKLNYTPGEQGQLGHITAADSTEAVVGRLAANTDCFYSAVIEALGSPRGMTIEKARQQVADHLESNTTCRRFYHNWSLDGQVKEFAGRQAAGNDSPLMFDGITQLDFVTDFIPGVSLVKDGISILVGVNPITGESLSDTERLMLGGGIFLPGTITGTLKGGAKVARKIIPKLAHGRANATQYERLKRWLRANMVRPNFETLQDKELGKFLNDFWRPYANIGNGSTAAAVRYERQTGLPVSDRRHKQKAVDGVKALERWLRNNPNASKRDQNIAETILKDTQDALNGW